MFCQTCGTENPDSSQFCMSCGRNLTANQPAVQQPYQQAPPYYSDSNQNPLFQSPPPQNAQYYNGNPYPQYPVAGNSAATASLVCGIISLFFFGFILGIIAIVQANKAKNAGYTGGKATAGMILGIIGLIGWGLVVILQFI